MPPIERIITCSDLASCFQAVYNLGLVILFSLAFLNMVYGAIEYLFSAGSITSKESGKNRIMNSIGAIIVVLVLPQILNIINPRIFQVKLKIPYLEKAKPPVFKEFNWGEAENFKQISPNVSAYYYWIDKNKLGNIKEYVCFTPAYPIKASPNDPNFSYTSFMGTTMSNFVRKRLEECVIPNYEERGKPLFRITQGYNPASADPCHKAGHCIDVIPNDNDYQFLLGTLVGCGFVVLNESGKTLECINEEGRKQVSPCPERCRTTTVSAPPQGCPCYFIGYHLHASLNIQPEQ